MSEAETRIRGLVARAHDLAGREAAIREESRALRAEAAGVLSRHRVRPLRFIAADAGVATSTVLQLERDNTAAGPDVIARVLAAAFEVSDR